MTLNEAIREGCRKLPVQAFEDWKGKEPNSGCVLWAAFVSIKPQEMYRDGIFKSLRAYFPELKTHAFCTSCGRESILARVLMHLNDDHRWTREAIAEWADPQPELHVSLAPLMQKPVRQRNVNSTASTKWRWCNKEGE